MIDLKNGYATFDTDELTDIANAMQQIKDLPKGDIRTLRPLYSLASLKTRLLTHEYYEALADLHRVEQMNEFEIPLVEIYTEQGRLQ